MRLRALAAAAAILLPVVGAGSTALAGEGGVWKKIPVSFTGEPGNASRSNTSATRTTSAWISSSASDDGVLTGDLQGTGMSGTTAASGPNTGNVVLQAFMVIFTGTVKGCGTGSLTFIGKARFDFDTLPAVDSDMVIVPDFGTGDLVGVTGSIHQNSSDPASPSVGWVRCKVKGHH